MTERLPPRPLEWIDRNKPFQFEFEGRTIDAFEGDVISSAVLASGQRTLARSFKYHRRRGLLSMANHDANVLLETARRTHIRGDVEAPVAGERYRAVNTLGGVRRDLTQCLGLLSRFLPVGFYYKAFYRPRQLFPYWERLIRHLAGLGKVNTAQQRERLPRRHHYADVLIIGAGASGLAAAEALLDSGLKVVVTDENPRAGGSLDYAHVADGDAQTFKTTALNNIRGAADFTVLSSHFAAGFYDDHSVPVVGPNGILNVHARAVVIATGAYEQPTVFPNNDLPGVMLASGAERLLHRYGVSSGHAVTVIAGHSGAYDTALNLKSHGVNVVAIADLANPESRGDRADAAFHAGVQVLGRVGIEGARARGGELAAASFRTGTERVQQTIECDALLMATGWTPAAGLLYQAGAKLDYDRVLEQIRPFEMPAGVFAAGKVNGIHSLEERLLDGRAAAAEVCSYLGLTGQTQSRRPRPSRASSHRYPVFAGGRGKAFVDFDEDLTVNDLVTSWREGFGSIELMKRYSTIGMGPSQGKVSNMNGVRIAAKLNSQSISAVGTTTTRPFVHPVPIRALAGRRMRRQWCTPLHEYHKANQAEIKEAGTWLRPMSYGPKPAEQAILDEYKAVREGVGLIDVSTLGKLEIFGADAPALLEYAYTCGFDKLKVGMTRYIFNVDGSGTLVDDGVAAKFSDEHFYLTTTSSHAQAGVRQLHLYAAQLKLKVAIVDRTFQVGAINVAGPRSREVMEKLTDLDLSETAFPYLAIRTSTVARVPARLMRVGFVGELGYEIHAPANQTAHRWQAILAAGDAFDVKPFGVDTQRLLRLEKGHLLFGQDTDGTTNPFEANLGWGVKLSKPRFMGKHSLTTLKPKRARRLVGFECKDGRARGILENHLVIEQSDIAGRITSVAFSPHRDAVIGLAMVDEPLHEVGRTLEVRIDDGTLVAVTCVETPFYDPDNLRQKAESQADV